MNLLASAFKSFGTAALIVGAVSLTTSAYGQIAMPVLAGNCPGTLVCTNRCPPIVPSCKVILNSCSCF